MYVFFFLSFELEFALSEDGKKEYWSFENFTLNVYLRKVRFTLIYIYIYAERITVGLCKPVKSITTYKYIYKKYHREKETDVKANSRFFPTMWEA